MPNYDIRPRWLLLLALTAAQASAQVFPVDSLQRSGPPSKRINFVFVSDGYRSTELATYITNVGQINTALFNTLPFSQYKSFFNVYAIKVPSTQSGAKHPGTASDEGTSGGQPVANPSTYFSSTFDYGSIHRLVVPGSSSTVTNVLAANVPDYDQGFILVNSPYYGGSGGSYATSTVHASAGEIAIHEIGHSFAVLADEYWAGPGYAAEKANMTQNNNPATVKWKNWYGVNSIGIYAYGASGVPAAWYRPHQNCKMQFLGSPFCSVCQEALVTKIHNLVNMIDNYTPASTNITLTGTGNVTFTVTHLQTTASTIRANWYLNNSTTPFARGVSSVSIPYASFVTGTNSVKVSVVDSTTLSRSYRPAVGYINSVTWSVKKSTSPLNNATVTEGERENIMYKVYQDAIQHRYLLMGATDIAVPMTIVVTDMNGRTVYRKRMGSVKGNFSQEVELQRFPAGMYLMNIYFGSQVYTAKLLAN